METAKTQALCRGNYYASMSTTPPPQLTMRFPRAIHIRLEVSVAPLTAQAPLRLAPRFLPADLETHGVSL